MPAAIRATVHSVSPSQRVPAAKATTTSVTTTHTITKVTPVASSYAPNQPVPTPFVQLENFSNQTKCRDNPQQKTSPTTSPHISSISASAEPCRVQTVKVSLHKDAPVGVNGPNETCKLEAVAAPFHHESPPSVQAPPTKVDALFELSSHTANTRLEDKLHELSREIYGVSTGNSPSSLQTRSTSAPVRPPTQTAEYRAYTYKPNGIPFEVLPTNNNNNNKDNELANVPAKRSPENKNIEDKVSIAKEFFEVTNKIVLHMKFTKILHIFYCCHFNKANRIREMFPNNVLMIFLRNLLFHL